jgi:transcriptional regulator with XRE-family HTH domain
MVAKEGTSAEALIARLDVPKYVLAGEVRMAPSDFSRIIAGRQTPTAKQAQRIADRLGVTPAELFAADGRAL